MSLRELNKIKHKQTKLRTVLFKKVKSGLPIQFLNPALNGIYEYGSLPFLFSAVKFSASKANGFLMLLLCTCRKRIPIKTVKPFGNKFPSEIQQFRVFLDAKISFKKKIRTELYIFFYGSSYDGNGREETQRFFYH